VSHCTVRSVIPQPTIDEQNTLIRSLAPVRLRRFRAATKGDRAAVRLYLLDSQIASQMHATIRVVEVALREHIHRALTEAFDERWFSSQRQLFDQDLCEKIDKVLLQVGDRAPAGAVIAQLMFGSWSSLLGRGGPKQDGTSAGYPATIWKPALESGFRDVTRTEARRAAMSLNWARNRISHCEPVVFGFPQPGLGETGTQVRRAPSLVLEDARAFTAYFDPALSAWMRKWNEIDRLLEDPLVSDALDHIAGEGAVRLER